MQPVGELTELGEPGAQLGEDSSELSLRLFRQFGVRRAANLELERCRHEPLLGAVVQVALDLPASSVGGFDDAGTRRANLGELGLNHLSLAERLLGRAADR